MQTTKLSLEQGIKLHPNVAYSPEKILPSVITKETYHVIDMKRVRKYLPQMLHKTSEINKYLPNIFNLKHDFKGVTEREAYDYRLSIFKRKDSANYNTHLIRVNMKLFELQKQHEVITKQEEELAEVLADFKEATNIFFEKTKYERRN
jgi:hypothetical protein